MFFKYFIQARAHTNWASRRVTSSHETSQPLCTWSIHDLLPSRAGRSLYPPPRDWRTELYWFDLDPSTPISHSAILVSQLGNGIFILEDFKTIISYGTGFRIFRWNTRLIAHLLQYACMYVKVELNVMKRPNHPVSHIVERIHCQGETLDSQDVFFNFVVETVNLAVSVLLLNRNTPKLLIITAFKNFLWLIGKDNPTLSMSIECWCRYI